MSEMAATQFNKVISNWMNKITLVNWQTSLAPPVTKHYVSVACTFYIFFSILSGLVFETELEPEEKFFQGGLEKFWKQVSQTVKKSCISLYIIHYKIFQIVRALWLAIKPFYMSVCKHGFRSSFISYFIKEM